jgi:hypothetical protein
MDLRRPMKDDRLIRQLLFDVVMGELGLDEQDMDDQDYASTKVDGWMRHYWNCKYANSSD